MTAPAALLLGAALVVFSPAGTACRDTCAAAATHTAAIAAFNGAAATSASNAWAVGSWSESGATYQGLIEHWNGSRWQIQPSPSPGDDTNTLYGVAATSASNVWAVGDYHINGLSMKTLVEHWNGSGWRVQPSPSPVTGNNILSAVDGLSTASAWAVGYTLSANGQEKTLIEHWNGSSWGVQHSPNRGGSSELTSVAALSSSNVWAVGYSMSSEGTITKTLAEHWNGSGWTVVASPNPGATYNDLCGVTAVSGTNAWAAGTYIQQGTGYQEPLMEHWDGRSWKPHASATQPPGYEYDPCAFAAASARSIWAVGSRVYLESDWTLAEHWNGTAWKTQSSPNPAPDDFDANVLNGAATTAGSNAWAVGWSYVHNSGHRRPLIEHWNGSGWKIQPCQAPA